MSWSGALRGKCPNMEFSWSVFYCSWTEYVGLLRKSPYSVQMQENTDQKNSIFGQFLRSGGITWDKPE